MAALVTVRFDIIDISPRKSPVLYNLQMRSRVLDPLPPHRYRSRSRVVTWPISVVVRCKHKLLRRVGAIIVTRNQSSRALFSLLTECG